MERLKLVYTFHRIYFTTFGGDMIGAIVMVLEFYFWISGFISGLDIWQNKIQVKKEYHLTLKQKLLVLKKSFQIVSKLS